MKIIYIYKLSVFMKKWRIMNKICSTLVTGALFFTNTLSSDSFQCFASSPKEDVLDNHTILFSGNDDVYLAEKMANYFGISLGSATVNKFKDGEIRIQLEEDVRNKNVLILQSEHSMISSANDHLMELYLLVRTMKRASASSITAIIPYYGQGKKFLARTPISKSDVALFLEVAGVDRVITIDLQGQKLVQSFSKNYSNNPFNPSIFARYFAAKDLQNVLIISPDTTGIERAQKLAEELENYGVPTQITIIDEKEFKGNVQGADVILIDEVYEPKGRLLQASETLQEQGAHRIFAILTRPVFSNTTLEQIGKSPIEEVVVANIVPLKTAPPNIRYISPPPLLGTAAQNNLDFLP